MSDLDDVFPRAPRRRSPRRRTRRDRLHDVGQTIVAVLSLLAFVAIMSLVLADWLMW